MLNPFTLLFCHFLTLFQLLATFTFGLRLFLTLITQIFALLFQTLSFQLSFTPVQFYLPTPFLFPVTLLNIFATFQFQSFTLLFVFPALPIIATVLIITIIITSIATVITSVIITIIRKATQPTAKMQWLKIPLLFLSP